MGDSAIFRGIIHLILGVILSLSTWACSSSFEALSSSSSKQSGSDSNNPGEPPSEPGGEELFTRTFIHAGPSSATIYWQDGSVLKSARSYVEYGTTTSYGDQTPTSTEDRWGQFHRLKDLQEDTLYHYRLVNVTAAGSLYSKDRVFRTSTPADAIEVQGGSVSSPVVLDQAGATYILKGDLTATGTAVEVRGAGINFDLDGHTVTFGTTGSAQVFGIHVIGGGYTSVRNGHVEQGAGVGEYNSGIETRNRDQPIEVFAMSSHVSGFNAWPFRLFGSATDARIHHNSFSSSVKDLQSRHYPGVDLLRVDASGRNIEIYDNILTEGCHRGLNLGGEAEGAIVSYNDIRHHALYVNGYAMNLHASDGIEVHHNRITSTGRGVHLTEADISFHDNYLDIKGHMTLSDLPANTRPFHERMIELHGVKFEGANVVRAKVFDNYVRITQFLPDADWEYVPATPLNISGYNANAMNEVYGNTFVALTHYTTTRHGGYGDSGQWASSIYLVGMDRGAASTGQYSMYIHNNRFVSNDLFVSSSTDVNMTVRVESNTFELVNSPLPTNTHTPFRGLGTAFEGVITSGNNTWEGMAP